VAGYKINIQKSVPFLYTKNSQNVKEIRGTIPFIVASKTIKYFGINLVKETKDFLMKSIYHYREKSKKTSEDGKNFYAHGISRINTVKMAMVPKPIHMVIANPIKILNTLCTEREIIIVQFIWKQKRP
jgi:hypothetical protein